MSSAPVTTEVSNPLYDSPGFQFLRSIRHHFAGRVHKATPSGRQQSAVLVVVPECLVICSNRGGFHTAVLLDDIVAVTIYPRGKLLLHIRGRHEIMLTTMQVTRIVSVLQQLLAGLSGRQLPVHQDDKAPVLEQLRLKPDVSFVARVPHRVVEAFKRAAVDIARLAVADAQRQLVDPAGREQEANPTRIENTPAQLTAHELVEKETFFQSVGPREAAASRATDDAVSAGSSKQSAAPKRQSGTGSRRKELDELTNTLTILIVRSGNSIITLPATRSLWLYLSTASAMLPGCKDPPTVTVQCVDSPLATPPSVMSADCLAQIMSQFARERPHTVTLQKSSAGEGHHFDAQVFWHSMVTESLGLQAVTAAANAMKL
jgi:hypothetical protein